MRILLNGSVALMVIVSLVLATGGPATADESNAADDTKSPLLTADDGKTIQLAVELISSRFLRHPDIDDVISQELMARFIRVWDPQKLYFLKSDISEFEQQKMSLDDQLKAGNIEFANSVFQRFHLRAMERLSGVVHWLDAEHDFTIDEAMTTDASLIDWAATDAEQDERWRKQIKYEILMFTLKGYDAPECRLRLRRQYERTQAVINQTQAFEILERYINSLLHCNDPHALYLSEESPTIPSYNIKYDAGIGIRIKELDGFLVVERVVSGGSAEGKIEIGDRILGVAQETDQQFADAWHMSLDVVYQAIRGRVGSFIRLQVQKKTGDTEVYSLRRTLASGHQLNSEPVGVIVDSSDWIAGTNTRIGLLKIPVFYRDYSSTLATKDRPGTARDVRSVLQRFTSENVAAVVLDLRGATNYGLLEAVEVCGLFIGHGPMLQWRETDEPVTTEACKGSEICWTRPVVIACDHTTEWIAELVAATIQDYRRGIVIGGKKTCGKGTLREGIVIRGSEESRYFPGRGTVFGTRFGMWRVNGQSIQRAGVVSDVVLPSLSDYLEPGEEALENALSLDPVPPVEYTPFTSYINEATIVEIARRSRNRVQASQEFHKINEQIEQYLERMQETTVSLNLAVAETQMQQSSGEDQSGARTDINGVEKDFFPRDFYHTELLHITLDYLKILAKQGE